MKLSEFYDRRFNALMTDLNIDQQGCHPRTSGDPVTGRTSGFPARWNDEKAADFHT